MRPIHPDPLRTRPALAGLGLLWTLCLSGCLDTEVIVFGEIDWNELVKPSLDRIHSDEMLPLFQSDGGKLGQEVASEVDWSSLRRSPGVYGYLPASRCLWVDATGFPIFTWDAVIADLRATDADGRALKLSTDRVSFAAGRATDPLTRDPLQVEGDVVKSIVPPDQAATVLMRAYTRASRPPHPFSPCVRLDEEPSLADLGAEGCEGAPHPNNFLPYTGIRCEKQAVPGDVSYELEAVGSLEMKDVVIDDRVIRTPPHVMEPTLMKVPDAGRTIARPLEFVGIEMVNASCNEVPLSLRGRCLEEKKYESDGVTPVPPRALWLWRWFTPSLDEDGHPIFDQVDPKGTRWEENWDPELRVTELGVFRFLGFDDGTGQPVTEAVAPRRILVNRGEAGGRRIDCEPDLTGDDPDACTRFFPEEAALLATPAYEIAALGQGERGNPPPKIEWTAEFRVDPDASGFYALPEVDPSDQLFIRFDLGGACSSCLSASVQPTARDLGEVRLSEQRVFERTFTIVNGGTSSIWVDALSLAGPSARDFVVRANPSTRLPARIDAGRTLGVDLVFKSDQYGIHSATLEAQVRAGGVVRTYRAPVVARAVDVIPHVLPDRIDLWDVDCPDVWQGYSEKSGLLENAGHLDLEVRSIAIEGPDASLFAMARREGNQLYPVGDESIAPGDAAEYRFFYFASQPGSLAPERVARVRFDTNGGEVTTELRGQACPH